MSKLSHKLYEFGSFRLDAADRMLSRGEEPLILPPKVLDTLLVLVEKDGRVVSKSELMEAIWPDAFVEESNLSQNIYTLRRTLGVDEQGRQFIETVPRRGYRFAVPVKSLADAPGAGEQPAETAAGSDAGTQHLEPGEGRVPASFLASTNESQGIETTRTVFSPAPRRAPPRRSHYTVWASLAVLITVSLGLVIYRFVPGPLKTGGTGIAPIEQIRLQRLTDVGDVVFSTISPNGELLAYVRDEEQGESVWVKQIATGSSAQALAPARTGYRSLVFSPDGSYLFFREETDPAAIYQTSVFGGDAVRIIADNVWSDFSLSPDGKQLAFIRRDPKRDNAYLLMLSNTDGSGERELNVRHSPLDYRSALAWSPDGKKLLVSAGLLQDVLPGLLTVDIATGDETELKTPRWRAISRGLWTPEGKHLICAARAIDETSSQLWMLTYPEGEVRRLTNDLEGYFWASLSSDGRMLVTRQQRITTNLWLLPDGDVKRAKQLTFGARSLDGYVGLAWTPDGKIVSSVFGANITDLYSMDADGNSRVQLTANSGLDNNYPATSRAGRYIVFTSNRTGTRQIWRMNMDGRNQRQLTFGDEQNESGQYPALAPDGAEAFFVKYGAGPAAIWKVPIEGGPPVAVSHLTNAATEGFLSISPDGKWLAYRHVAGQPETRTERPTLKIGVLRADGIGEAKVFDLQMRPPIVQWAPDSAGLFYTAGTLKSSSLWRQPLAGGTAQELIDFPDRIFNFAWSHDAKNLVVSRGRQQGDAILIANLP